MEIDNEPNSPDVSSPSTSSPLYGWSKLEKYYLYLGIKLIGSKDVKEIQELISNKTIEEVEAAITYYKEKANKKPDCANKVSKIRKNKAMTLIPLASWAKMLTDNYDLNDLQTETVGALRLIADLDNNIAPSSCTEHINFRQVYHHIADAMEGKSLPKNPFIAEVLHSCIIETALYSKTFINQSTLRNIISAISLKEKPRIALARPTKSCELAIIRHLAAQENYNPLGISVDNLLPMSVVPFANPE